VAVQLMPPTGPSLMTRTIGQLNLGTYGAPSYLDRFGVPARPDDLANHKLVAFSFGTGQVQMPLYMADNRSVAIDNARVSTTFNDGEAMVDAARAGLGLTQVSTLHAAHAVARGELVQVLAGCDAPGPPLRLVYAPGRHLSRRVRVFVDFLATCHPPGEARYLGAGQSG
jgi:DNA-binding transcriptional LysR family regulator